ncbi:Putative S- transferase [Salmonella enterica subsp. enterica]|uniref:S- transferase n=1 Tax=Salmonella enterica I TaxID=59201 RepID=A0A379WQR8_SALET|nr:Putative S- transferase [Salmonella enterica subsp. enterica]
MNFPFEGLTSGSKFGTAVGIIMFMLVIGGAFGIVMRTGTVDNGILALIRHTRATKSCLFRCYLSLFVRGRRIWHGRRGGRLCNYHSPADGQAGL